MDLAIRYGRNARLSVQLDPDQIQVSSLADSHGSFPVAEIGERLHAVLAEPLSCPALGEWIVPGDHVAIVVDPEVPQPATFINGVLSFLESLERRPDRITVLVPAGEPERWEAIQRDDAGGIPVQVLVHDPGDQEGLGFLTANQDGEPVYLNRGLTDADLVIPILATRLESAFGYRGVFTGIHPTYSDRSGQERFAAATDSRSGQRKLRGETNEVGFALGLPFLVQVIPSHGGEIHEVLAGEAAAVQQQSYRLAERRWSLSTESPAAVVIATLGGERQTWDALARLLIHIEAFCEPNATVVICSEIAEPPSMALRELRSLDYDPDATFREIRQHHSGDATTALLLAQLRESHPIFFYSDLQDEEVEELGLGAIADGEEISRLCRNRTVTILEDAEQVNPATHTAAAERTAES